MMHEPVFSTNSFSNHFFSQLEDLEKATKCVDLGNCGEKIMLNPSMKEELTRKQNSLVKSYLSEKSYLNFLLDIKKGDNQSFCPQKKGKSLLKKFTSNESYKILQIKKIKENFYLKAIRSCKLEVCVGRKNNQLRIVHLNNLVSCIYLFKIDLFFYFFFSS